MVLIKLGVLAFFIVIAFIAFDCSNLTPFTPEGICGISAALPAIFFTFSASMPSPPPVRR